jgi:GT2 family glycosyltransferase
VPKSRVYILENKRGSLWLVHVGINIYPIAENYKSSLVSSHAKQLPYFNKNNHVFARRALALSDEAIPSGKRRLLRQNQERLAATWEELVGFFTGAICCISRSCFAQVLMKQW